MSWITKLEERWEVKGWWQITVIFIVFAITGSSSVFVGKYIMTYIGITPETNPWIRIPVRILMVFVVYQILLIWIGFLFGQFKFFWNFEQKMYKRIGSLFTRNKAKSI